MGKEWKSDVVRCPFCVQEGQFKVMTLQSGSTYYSCDSCGHLTLPTNRHFQCSCSKCVALRVTSGTMILPGSPALENPNPDNDAWAGHQVPPKRSHH